MPTQQETIIEIKNVSKSFQKEAGQDVLVLDDINLTLKKNEIVARQENTYRF